MSATVSATYRDIHQRSLLAFRDKYSATTARHYAYASAPRLNVHSAARDLSAVDQGHFRHFQFLVQRDMNVIALWNTLYMEAALTQLRKQGFPVRNEDVVRLSPLTCEHINMLGRYSFAVPDAVARGEMRPLRNPADDNT
jgi:hypothetical protein